MSRLSHQTDRSEAELQISEAFFCGVYVGQPVEDEVVLVDEVLVEKLPEVVLAFQPP